MRLRTISVVILRLLLCGMDQLEQLGFVAVICCFWMDLDGAGSTSTIIFEPWVYYYRWTRGFIRARQALQLQGLA